MDSRQLQRQQVVAGINARAAVDDSALAFFDPDLLETFPQLSRRLEAPVLTQVSRPGSATRAGDVAGFGIYRLLLSSIGTSLNRTTSSKWRTFEGSGGRAVKSPGEMRGSIFSSGPSQALRPPSSTACSA